MTGRQVGQNPVSEGFWAGPMSSLVWPALGDDVQSIKCGAAADQKESVNN